MRASSKPIGVAHKRGLTCQQLKRLRKLDKLAKDSKCWAGDALIGEADQGGIREEDAPSAVVLGVAQAAGGTLTASIESLRHDDAIASGATHLNAERAADEDHSTVALGKSANGRVAI